MITDDKTALVTPAEFAALAEYSCSLPTGTTIGKTWKLDETFFPLKEDMYVFRPKKWKLGEYVPHPEPNTVGIKWRELLVVR